MSKARWVVSVSGVLLIFALSGLMGCFPASSPGTTESLLWGDVRVNGVVHNGSVVVSDASTGEVVWTGMTSKGRFLDRPLMTAGADYLVSVDSGWIGSKVNAMTLKAFVSDYTPGEFIHVNLLSTLLVAYMDASGLSFADAETKLKEHLQITSSKRLVTLPYHGALTRQFCSHRFVKIAREHGGLATYIPWLAEMFATQGGSVQFDAFGGLQGSSDEGYLIGGRSTAAAKALTRSSLLADIAAEAGLSLLKGIGEGLGEEGVGWVMEMLGKDDPEQEVLDKLDEVQDQLADIDVEIQAMDQDIQDLARQISLNLEQDRLADFEEELTYIEDLIDAEWSKLIAYQSRTPTDAELDALAGEYLEYSYAGSTGISTLMAQYHSKLVGSGGYLRTYSDVLTRTKVTEDRDNLLDVYLLLEKVFNRAMTYQTKVINMNVEALHYRQAQGEVVTQTAEDFYRSAIANYIRPELVAFIEAVDQLVVRYTDTRIRVPRSANALPIDVETVYARADFTCAVADAETFGGGAVVRLIGPPGAVQWWLDNQHCTAGDDQIPLTPTYAGGLSVSTYNSLGMDSSCYHVLTTDVVDVSFAMANEYIGIDRLVTYRHDAHSKRPEYQADAYSYVAVARLSYPVDSEQDVAIRCALDADYYGVTAEEQRIDVTIPVKPCYQDATFMASETSPYGQPAETGLEDGFPVYYGSAVISAFDTYAPGVPTEAYHDSDYPSKHWSEPQFSYDLESQSMAITMNGHGGSHAYTAASAYVGLHGMFIALMSEDALDKAVLSVDFTGSLHVHKNNSDPLYHLHLDRSDIQKAHPESKDSKASYGGDDLVTLDAGVTSSDPIIHLTPELMFESYDKFYVVDGDKVHNDLDAQVRVIQIAGPR